MRRAREAILRATAYAVVLALVCLHLFPARAAIPAAKVVVASMISASDAPSSPSSRSEDEGAAAGDDRNAAERERGDDSERSESDAEDDVFEELEAFLPPSTPTTAGAPSARFRTVITVAPPAAEREVASPPPEA